ncbi:SCP2 domain-containing protein [Alginatibacterium sediminis]|uniref:Ubiquinone biosynthesis accessory factor UbiT n=2 Tax=Alginatibacterium sediminis TaxID=2164068 RepID=A0A420EA31_9ALTE|nr:SCP2 domain-containing protein [Alginatibacterium sediminis]
MIALAAKLMPLQMQALMIQKGLGQLFVEQIEDGDLDFLEHNYLKLEISDLDLRWWISFADNQFLVSSIEQTHAVSFSGQINDLMLMMGREEDPDSLFFQRRLKIEGDTELGLYVKNLLDSLDDEQMPVLLQKALKFSAGFIAKYRN